MPGLQDGDGSWLSQLHELQASSPLPLSPSLVFNRKQKKIDQLKMELAETRKWLRIRNDELIALRGYESVIDLFEEKQEQYDRANKATQELMNIKRNIQLFADSLISGRLGG